MVGLESTGLDVVSAISAVLSIVDAAIRIMKELYEARERQSNLSKVLATHYEELHNLCQVLGIVRQENALQIQALLDDLRQLEYHGKDLYTALQELGRERGQMKQFANQVINGRKSLNDLASIMANMSRAKENISIKIQVVHVGLTNSIGDIVLVNSELVAKLDQKLQMALGPGKGLKLAELVQHKKRDRDGTVHLKNSDIASLSDSENSTLDSVGVKSKDSTSRVVERNETKDQALQLNAPIGIGGFVEVDHLVIMDNKAIHRSIQVNHAVSQDNFDKIFAARLAGF